MTAALESKRAFIAGDGLVAKAIVRRFERDGATVHADEGDAVALAREGRARAAIAEATSALGDIDVLVTAFCVREDRPFLEIDDELWLRTLDGNLKAAFLVAREGARAMKAGVGGTIVHVGSDLAARPGPGSGAYAAAKAGVHLLATVMALDLAPDGVRVCCVAAVDSDSSKGPDVDDVAGAVSFCASDKASYVLGSTFYLDGPVPVRG